MSCQKHDIIVLGGCTASPWLLLLYSLSQSAREIIFIFLLASFPSSSQHSTQIIYYFGLYIYIAVYSTSMSLEYNVYTYVQS